VNVDPAVQRKLLDLAAIDAELARITHRRVTLPEAQEIERLETERQARKDAAVGVEITLDDLDRDIRKLEREVEAVRNREEKDHKLLASGTVSPKQMTELQHELDTLTRRQSILEDEELEVMERREASAADRDHAGSQLSKVEDELVDARRRHGDAVADLDTSEKRCQSDRAGMGNEFPSDLLAVYERQRASRGAGAALLQARRCGACRMELDRNLMAQFAAAPAEQVLRCEECGVILVRTNESGL